MEDEKCLRNISRSRSSKRKGFSKGLKQVTKLDKHNAGYAEVQDRENQHKANLKTSFFKTGAYITANCRSVHPITLGMPTICP